MRFGLSSSFEMRYVGDRVADDFGHHTARGYMLFNSTTRYRYRNFEAFLTVENITNTDWREAQFFSGRRAHCVGTARAAHRSADHGVVEGSRRSQRHHHQR